MADAESTEVLNAILAPSTPAKASEAGGEAATKPADAPSRAADGRFASNEPAEADAGDDAVLDAITDTDEQDAPEADDQAEEEEAEAEGEEQPDEEAPKNLDEYTVDVVIDGKPSEVTLGELKRNYSGAKYVERNIQEAVEYRKANEAATYRTYAVLQQQVDHLNAIEEVWNKFATPQADLESLRHQNPQAYALKRVELIEAQEKAQKIQQEISNRQSQQAEIVAHAKAQRVEDETRILLQKLPALADPQKAPVVMGKIREVAQSYGVSDDELNGLDGHVPLMVLAELAWRRDQMAGIEARMKRPTGDQPRPKTLLRPGTAKPAQSSAKKLEAQLLTRARKSGKPDDVAATLLVARKR
jgi:hypothetical protein